MMRAMRSLSSLRIGFLAVAISAACSEIETSYFRTKVGEATQEKVAHRYGAPHRLERLSGGRSVWTYFDRGSGTSRYAGYVRDHYCRAYILTFDEKTEILKEWREEDCGEKKQPVNNPSSDRP